MAGPRSGGSADGRDHHRRRRTDDRELDYRALTEYMTVLLDGDVRARSSDLYTVTTQSGREYFVDVRVEACECPNHEYRDRMCKNFRRVRFASGRREIPEWIEPDDVDLRTQSE